MYDVLTNRMISNFNPNSDYMRFLIESYVSIYGEACRDVIIKRINSTHFNFSSLPIFLSKYVDKYSSLVSDVDKIEVEQCVNEYNKWKKMFHEWYEYKFKDFLKNTLNVSEDIPMSAFTNADFSSGLIDSCNMYHESLLNSKFVIPKLQESIKNERDQFKKALEQSGIDISNITFDKIEEIVNYRNELYKKYKCSIARNTFEGQNILDEIKSQYNYELEDEDLFNVVYITYGCSYTLHQIDASIVKIPIVMMKYLDINFIDETFNHELVHIIDDATNYSTIIDEIRVEKLAIKITDMLHSNGLFLFDNPKDYKRCTSIYTLLFPLVSNFFEEHSSILNECAITNQNELLETYFGDDWKRFCSDLQEVYNCLSACHRRGFYEKYDLEKYQSYFNEIIENMNNYYSEYKSKKI